MRTRDAGVDSSGSRHRLEKKEFANEDRRRKDDPNEDSGRSVNGLNGSIRTRTNAPSVAGSRRAGTGRMSATGMRSG